jgi:hypothetical protein
MRAERQIIMLQEVKKPRVYSLLLAVVCIGLASAPVIAQDAETGEGEAFEANIFEVFLGGTFDDGESNASFGMSYERRLKESFGIGGLVEYTNGREWVYAVPFTVHINEAWKVMVAPGFEHADGENTYLTRIGTAYDFKFDGWSLAPEVNLDFVDGETKVVVGVSFGIEF